MRRLLTAAVLVAVALLAQGCVGNCIQQCGPTVKETCGTDTECVKEALRACFEACGEGL